MNYHHSVNFLMHYTLLLYSLDFAVKKEGWGGGGSRMIKFARGQGDVPVLKVSGKTLTVSVGSGLPKDSSMFICFYKFFMQFLLYIFEL